MKATGRAPYPVVLVHGLFQGLGHLRAHSLTTPGRFVILDLLGYGAHAGTTSPSILNEQVEHVEAELNRMGISRCVLVGHSVGGAVAMLHAARYPGRVAAVVNVEGNFTLADAFWSSKVAQMNSREAEVMLDEFRGDVAGWLRRQGIEPTAPRLNWTRQMFEAQPAGSVQALARGVVETTSSPHYLETIGRVWDAGIPVHLVAGERSRDGWAIPETFRRRAASDTVQAGVGHMMPLEDPEGFLAIVESKAG